MGFRSHACVRLSALALATFAATAAAQETPHRVDRRARRTAQGATPSEAAPAPPLGATPGPADGPEEPCLPGNLVPLARITGPGERSEQFRIRDRRLAREGSEWSSTAALQVPARGGRLVLDFGRPRDVRNLVLQGDNNDFYVVEGSSDGIRYRALWTAAPVEGLGLRTRWIELAKTERIQHLRVTARGGDGFYSISELQAYCKRPTPWPPKLNEPPKRPGLLGMWDWIDNDRMVVIKGVLAAVGMLVLLAMKFPWRRVLVRPRAWRDVPLLTGGVGAFGWGCVEREPWSFGIGAALLVGWFALRWLAGPAEAPRRILAPVGRVLASRPAAALHVLATLAAGPAVWWKLDWRWALAAVAALVALWHVIRWLRRPVTFANTGTFVLGVLGLVAFASWWNLGHFHFNHHVHIWEHYHYYMGAKYGPELRFARLYECTAAADMADGLTSRVKKRKMRDLGLTNELGTSDAIVKDPKRCTSHFTPERWDAFRKDIRFFRGRFSQDRWDQSQTDHGYNGTPVWAVLGRLIADRVDLTWGAIEAMAVIDSVILVLMWLVVWWAFGWEATCVGLLWWGTNFPARYYWNGGSFLRYDWIVWMIVGICLLRKERNFSAGLALTYATLLRIFPGFVVAALVLKVLARMVREQRFVVAREHWSFAAGCIVAFAILLPASSWATGGMDSWSEFAQNSEKHLRTALTNNMGLKTVLGFDFATRAKRMRNNALEDPFAEWKDARGYFYAKREPLLIALVFLFCLMLGRAGDREPDWVAACLGTGLIVMAAELTCYYYGFLLSYGLLWGRRALPGIAAAALASATCWFSFIAWNDEHFGAMSLASVVTVVGVTAHVAFGRAVPRTSQTKSVLLAPAGARPHDRG